MKAGGLGPLDSRQVFSAKPPPPPPPPGTTVLPRVSVDVRPGPVGGCKGRRGGEAGRAAGSLWTEPLSVDHAGQGRELGCSEWGFRKVEALESPSRAQAGGAGRGEGTREDLMVHEGSGLRQRGQPLCDGGRHTGIGKGPLLAPLRLSVRCPGRGQFYPQ